MREGRPAKRRETAAAVTPAPAVLVSKLPARRLTPPVGTAALVKVVSLYEAARRQKVKAKLLEGGFGKPVLGTEDAFYAAVLVVVAGEARAAGVEARQTAAVPAVRDAGEIGDVVVAALSDPAGEADTPDKETVMVLAVSFGVGARPPLIA